MAKELILEVVARSSSRDLSRLAEEFDKTAVKAELAGKSMNKTASFSQLLDRELTRTRATVKELGAEFDRTGNKDVFGKLTGAQSNLRRLEGIKKQLSSALEQAGDDAGKGFLQNLAGELGNPRGAAIGGAALAGGLVIGNVVAAGILTGVGLGGVAAGIAGQLHNPLIVQNAAKLGQDVSAGFKDATSSFVGPLDTALANIDREWLKLQPGLKSTFEQLSPLVLDLEHGAEGFIDQLVPGLERAAVASKPLVQDFAQYLPHLGHEVGDFFDALARNANGLKTGLHDIEGGLDGVVKTATVLVPVVSTVGEVFGKAKYLLGPVGPLLHLLGEGIDFVHGKTPGMEILARSLVHDAEAMSQLTHAATEAKTATDAVFQGLLGLDQADLAVAKSLTDAADALKTNKRALDVHSAAGQADRAAILGAVEANVRSYDAMIQSGISAEDAARAYDDNTAALERQLSKAGLTTNQIQGLVGKYEQVPSKINTVLATQGLTSSINNLSDLLRLINHIPRAIHFDVIAHTVGTSILAAAGGRAAGGPVKAGVPYVVGEKRPELFVPNVSGRIVPDLSSVATSSASYGTPTRSVGGWGRGQTTVNLHATFVTPSGEVMHKQLITYALDSGRSPADLFPTSMR